MRSGEVVRISHNHLKGTTLFIPITKTVPRTIPLTKKAVELINEAKLPFNTTVDMVGKKHAKIMTFKIGSKDTKLYLRSMQKLNDNYFFHARATQ